MRFSLKQKDALSFAALVERVGWNIDISDFLNEEVLSGEKASGPFFEFLEGIEKGKSKLLPHKLSGYDEELPKGHIPKFFHLDEEEYLSNPVYKALQGIKGKKGDLVLSEGRYLPYAPFLLTEISGNKELGYAEENSLGYFDCEFPFPRLEQKGTTWMSVTPHEIKTMEPFIRTAKGKILVHGLGLGYLPAMLALKDDVSLIEVIELDQKVIDLFFEAVYPRLQNKEKIKVKHGNAMEVGFPDGYDHYFVDIYHNEADGLPIYASYLKLEGSEKATYWIEKTLLTYYRRIVMEVMFEEAEGLSGEGDDSEFSALFDKTKKALEGLEVTSFSQIIDMLEDRKLKRLLASL